MSNSDAMLVIGHRRPDLDSVASAIGYAALLRERGQDARAVRPGPVDQQTQWALARFGLETPEAVLDVAPTFGRIARAVAPAAPGTSLAEVVRRIADGERAVPVVDAAGHPLAIVDARVCVRLLGLAGAKGGPAGSPESIREGAARAAQPILSSPSGEASELGGELGGLPAFAASERVADRRAAVMRADADDFLVVAADGRYAGVARRSEVLAPPRARLVLVDHNELSQAVPGADEADLVEVLDHHRLGNPRTAAPIPFSIDPVGATATLVEERWRAAGLELPAPVAGVLLAAVISDTLAFRSPTTTDRDRAAARRLAERAGVADLDTFGGEVVSVGAGLAERSGDDVVGEDFKEYETHAGRLLVAQAEVKSIPEAERRAADLAPALERLRERRGAALALLLLTDPVRGLSRLIARGEPPLVARVPYPDLGDGTLDAGPVVSRKKQLIPALLAALE